MVTQTGARAECEGVMAHRGQGATSDSTIACRRQAAPSYCDSKNGAQWDGRLFGAFPMLAAARQPLNVNHHSSALSPAPPQHNESPIYTQRTPAHNLVGGVRVTVWSRAILRMTYWTRRCHTATVG